MQNYQLKALVAASFLAATAPMVAPAAAADVAVIIDGIEIGRGIIKVAFCNQGPLDSCKLYAGEQPASAETMGFRFDGIPAGTYAFVGYQDMDSSGENERNLFGIPQEPFALGSGDVQLVPPPEFEDIAVPVADGDINVIRLTLRTLTRSQKKKGAPTIPWEQVPLLPVLPTGTQP
ncbi:MAG: DUF2141 domain-containing protein [Parvibaculaceae bacterium]